MSTDTQKDKRIKDLEYLVEKLVLDGEQLASVAARFQAVLNEVAAATEVLENADPQEDTALAKASLSESEQERSDYWGGLQLAIHEFRKRAATATAAMASAVATSATRQAPQVSILICPHCESGVKTYWPQEPFAYFQRNEGWNVWEEVVPEARNQPGVVAAYSFPLPDMSMVSTYPENMSIKPEKIDISRDQLRLLLKEARQHVDSQNKAEGMLEGFGGRKPRPTDRLLARIDAAIKESQEENTLSSTQDSLLCEQCGADRFKEDCRGERSHCAVVGVAHAAAIPATSKPRIIINLPNQTLELRGRNNSLIRHYRIASGYNGAGEVNGSECTPRGRHIVRAKIGAGMPVGTMFVNRRPTGEIYSSEWVSSDPRRDLVLTRILWLSGCEPGVNRLGDVDTMRRFIYIHGCPDHIPMGIPSSHGCIRMRNVDVIDLFDLVPAGTAVDIIE